MKANRVDPRGQSGLGSTHRASEASYVHRSYVRCGSRLTIEAREATEHEIQNVMESVAHPYFADALKKFLRGERKNSHHQATLPD